MKKIYSLLLPALTVLTSVTANGAPLTPRQALQRATASHSALRAPAINNAASATLAYAESDDTRQPTLYIFNMPEGGYMVVSGDDIAAPVLGYSSDGNFDSGTMPQNLKWWLGEYSREISAARAMGIQGDVNAYNAKAADTKKPSSRWSKPNGDKARHSTSYAPRWMARPHTRVAWRPPRRNS